MSPVEPGSGPGPALEPWLREVLRCPACRSTFADGVGPTGEPELVCTADAPGGCRRAYRVDDGIPVLLVDTGRLPTDS